MQFLLPKAIGPMAMFMREQGFAVWAVTSTGSNLSL